MPGTSAVNVMSRSVSTTSIAERAQILENSCDNGALSMSTSFVSRFSSMAGTIEKNDCSNVRKLSIALCIRPFTFARAASTSNPEVSWLDEAHSPDDVSEPEFRGDWRER